MVGERSTSIGRILAREENFAAPEPAIHVCLMRSKAGRSSAATPEKSHSSGAMKRSLIRPRSPGSRRRWITIRSSAGSWLRKCLWPGYRFK